MGISIMATFARPEYCIQIVLSNTCIILCVSPSDETNCEKHSKLMATAPKTNYGREGLMAAVVIRDSMAFYLIIRSQWPSPEVHSPKRLIPPSCGGCSKETAAGWVLSNAICRTVSQWAIEISIGLWLMEFAHSAMVLLRSSGIHASQWAKAVGKGTLQNMSAEENARVKRRITRSKSFLIGLRKLISHQS